MDMADIQRQKTLEEIQKMTGSVKMLSEKQIGEMDERFVQQQLAFETTQERRKNFMEGRGMTVSPAFIETNARVINNEKVHSRGDKKSLRRQKDTYTEIFNDRYAQMNADRQELRDAFEQDAETSFIHARAFASAYQYDTLRDAKKWMTENPERYAANKKAVNAIYRDLYAASEVYGTYTTKAVTYDALYNDIEEKKARMSPELVKQMHSEFDRRSDIEAARQRLVERRISLLTRALEELLRGREQNDMVKEVLREYMPMDYTNSEKEEMRRHAGGAREREEAGIAAVKPFYIEKLKEDENYNFYVANGLDKAVEQMLRESANKMYLLYREGDDAWNERLADWMYQKKDGFIWTRHHTEQYVNEFYDGPAREIDIEPYLSMSDQQLMEHASEFEQAGITASVIRELEQGMALDRDPGVWMTMREAYKEDRGLSGDALFQKSALLALYAKKARLLWYVEAHKMGMLNARLVSREDQSEGIAGNPDAMLAAVKKQLARCNAGIKSGKKRYLSSLGAA